jgi:hypothetical protein
LFLLLDLPTISFLALGSDLHFLFWSKFLDRAGTPNRDKMAVIPIYAQLGQFGLRRECRTASHKFSNGQNFEPIVILVYNPSRDHIHVAKAGTGFDTSKLHSMGARVDPDTLERTSLSTLNIDHWSPHQLVSSRRV